MKNQTTKAVINVVITLTAAKTITNVSGNAINNKIKLITLTSLGDFDKCFIA